MAVEHAPRSERASTEPSPDGRTSRAAAATFALFLVPQLPDDQFLSWGWRIPFLFSAVLIVHRPGGGAPLSAAPTSPNCARPRAWSASRSWMRFASTWRQILLVAGTYVSQGVFAYICVAYLVSYGTSVVKIAPGRFSACSSPRGGGGDVSTLRIAVRPGPPQGPLSVVVGLMAVTIGPVFALINTGRPVLFLVALVLVFGHAIAPRPASPVPCSPCVFDADVRYSGVSIGYTLSQVVGSAFAPTIAAALYNATKSSDASIRRRRHPWRAARRPSPVLLRRARERIPAEEPAGVLPVILLMSVSSAPAALSSASTCSGASGQKQSECG